jgi:predicted  nucleic acid-binding Zn-ribbon protein
VRDLDLQIRFSGRPGAPTLDVSSNVGAAVSSALTREVGAEVARVQARARARVDSIVGQQVAAARAKLAALQTDVQSRLGAQQQQLQDAQAELERRLQELGQVVPGVRLPSIPRIRP